MNPLDFRGPEFLVFYLAWSSVVLGILWIVRERWERRIPPGGALPAGRLAPGTYPREEDAYAIALLRGGLEETARALLARLVAEGSVVIDGRELKRPDPPPDTGRLEPLEQEVLHSILPPAGSGIAAQEAEKRVLQVVQYRSTEMQNDLEGQGLAPAEPQRRMYALFRNIGLVAILGLGLVKLLIGVSRERPVGFLVLLLLAFGFGCLYILRTPGQTPAGRQYLAWLQESHRGLVQMIEQGRRTGYGELALAAGIYGLTVLPGFAPLLTALTPPRSADSGCSSSSSSCSSSSNGCGGGGCGGGGCGGCGG
jgi:uncharacterized protein (TIGR04222 family)